MKFIIGTLCVYMGLLLAESLQIPPEGWEPEPSPFASEWAEPGGKIKVFASQYPSSFNYYLDQNVFSRRLFSYQFEPLLGEARSWRRRLPWKICRTMTTPRPTIARASPASSSVKPDCVSRGLTEARLRR